jgi:hypothetical protein
MLAEARTALKSSEGESSRANQAKAILVAVKTLNRAGGFLEAISIVNPDLGSELIEEFEAFAREIQVLSGEPAQLVRALKERRERAERRGPDRRLAIRSVQPVERELRHQGGAHQLAELVVRDLGGFLRPQLDRPGARLEL